MLVLICINVPWSLGYVELGVPRTFKLDAATGIRFFIGVIANITFYSIALFLGLVAMLFFLRVLLRSHKTALAVTVLLAVFVNGFGPLWEFALLLVVYALFFYVLMRFGLVAVVISFAYYALLDALPTTLDASAWYSPYGFAALAIFAALVLYAFRFSFGSRPILAPSRLDD
jgi:hypothetical protein